MSDKKKRIYISGKMKGLSDYRTYFNDAEELLKNEYTVINPARFEHTSDKWEDRMLHDLNVLKSCDAIYMIPNWTDSNGAQVEYYFAKGMELEIIYGQD